MTILVLAQRADVLVRCGQWLADSGERLIGVTGDRCSAADSAGFARVDQVPRYASSTAVELAALRIGREFQLSAIVATGFADLLRAGCLRDYLGVPGQGRADALACVDLVVQREALHRAGVPVVPALQVRSPAELCWRSKEIGLPLRLRCRRAPGWSTTVMIATRDDLRAVLEREQNLSWGMMLAEPVLPGERFLIPLTQVTADTRKPIHGMVAGPALDRDTRHARIITGVRQALPDSGGLLFAVGALKLADGRVLVDNVLAVPEDHLERQRSVVRMQAALGEVEPVS